MYKIKYKKIDNKKNPTSIGTIVLVIIAVSAGVFVWAYEKEQNQDAVAETQVTLKKVVSDKQKNSDTEITLIEPVSEWKTYQDEKYGFEFKYPKSFDVKFTDHYSISDSSKEVMSFSVKKWKGYIIQENTPGTLWEKIAYANWKYFADNFRNISLGQCDNETLKHVPGPTPADTPRLCTISKQGGILRVETEDHITFFTKDLEVRWESNQNSNDLVKKVSSTLVIK